MDSLTALWGAVSWRHLAEGQSHLAQTRTPKQLKQRCPTRLLLSPSLLLQLLPKDLLVKKHNNSSRDVPPALYVQSPITVDSAPIMDEFNSEVVRNHHMAFNREMFGIDENGNAITGTYVSKGLPVSFIPKKPLKP